MSPSLPEVQFPHLENGADNTSLLRLNTAMWVQEPSTVLVQSGPSTDCRPSRPPAWLGGPPDSVGAQAIRNWKLPGSPSCAHLPGPSVVPAKVYPLQPGIYEDAATAHFLSCSFHGRQLKYTKTKDTGSSQTLLNAHNRIL